MQRAILQRCRRLATTHCAPSLASPKATAKSLIRRPQHARLVSSSPAPPRKLVHDPEFDDIDSLAAEDFGSFSVVFPPEPYNWDVHNAPKPTPPLALPPSSIPPYVNNPRQVTYQGHGRMDLHGDDARRLRESAALAAKVLDWAGSLVEVGVTTAEIDARVHEYILSQGAYPSPLTYSGFPKSCCTSVNNIIAHGIPDDRELENGDIINIDITVYKNGMHGDTSRTFLVGDVDDKGRNLVKTSLDALHAGISVCGPHVPYKAIGRAIDDVARRRGYSISQMFTGHGIGSVFHRPPWIHHTVNEEPGVMLPGQCFTIEPCLIQGTNTEAFMWPDGWTTSTLANSPRNHQNCARSAQFEHMVLITETGADVLTRWPNP
ncbi:Creatinase/aminopeptidase [Punctularia strigosozonata HHB-11173 SS5]|uniref:Creatinase/aminopeptidase n=1 Tax=Punctularia strigosozonata (strain HHB-11173) TaxID=741275 RepID=UPI0004417303|nr:Creatinase/aminopeptidase [Punctularia strigosozonata HHB-11173 SS5]EIN11026.1 Creatinase/aminopeptidase [Punctularia strigosozonata HHB-11173 SS5]